MSTASRMLLLLALSWAVLPLAGCWDRIEVNDLAIITATGMDKGTDDMIELTVLVVVPKPTSEGPQMVGQDEGSQSGGGAKRTLYRSAEGRTIAEALSKLQHQFPRRLFWGHNKVIIIGKELADKDIRPQFDYILRHPQLRIRSHVFVSEGKAKDVLSLFPPMERDLAELLKENAVINGGLDITTKQLAQMLISDSNAAALPYIKLLPAPPGQGEKQKIIHVDGTAVFQNGKIVGTLSGRATEGLLWLRDEMKKATITIKPRDTEGYVSMILLHSSTRLKPKIANGKWRIRLNAEAEMDVYQNASKLDITDEKITRMLEQELNAEIEQRIQEVLEIVQKKLKADILGFANAFHRGYPAIWKQNKKRWDEIFPNVEVSFDIKAKVKRPGLVRQPGLIPEEEIRKKLE